MATQSQVATALEKAAHEIIELNKTIEFGLGARRRAVKVIQQYRDTVGTSRKYMEALAKKTGVHVATLYRWIKLEDQARAHKPKPRDKMRRKLFGDDCEARHAQEADELNRVFYRLRSTDGTEPKITWAPLAPDPAASQRNDDVGFEWSPKEPVEDRYRAVLFATRDELLKIATPPEPIERKELLEEIAESLNAGHPDTTAQRFERFVDQLRKRLGITKPGAKVTEFLEKCDDVVERNAMLKKFDDVWHEMPWQKQQSLLTEKSSAAAA